VEKNGYVSAPLLTVGEAARYLGVGRKVIYQLMERGELTVLRRSGSEKLIEKKSLDEFRRRGGLT
jgi:excisionase family DNA binding protein